MDSDTTFIFLIVGSVLVTMLVIWWQKAELPFRIEKRSRTIRRLEESVPYMGKINVPCDPELLDEYVKALSRAQVKFLPPTEPEPPMPYPYGHYPSSDRCFILVAEEDSQRAEQIIAEVNRNFYL
jgi:hypothetical protein